MEQYDDDDDPIVRSERKLKGEDGIGNKRPEKPNPSSESAKPNPSVSSQLNPPFKPQIPNSNLNPQSQVLKQSHKSPVSGFQGKPYTPQESANSLNQSTSSSVKSNEKLPGAANPPNSANPLPSALNTEKNANAPFSDPKQNPKSVFRLEDNRSGLFDEPSQPAVYKNPPRVNPEVQNKAPFNELPAGLIEPRPQILESNPEPQVVKVPKPVIEESKNLENIPKNPEINSAQVFDNKKNVSDQIEPVPKSPFPNIFPQTSPEVNSQLIQRENKALDQPAKPEHLNPVLKDIKPNSIKVEKPILPVNNNFAARIVAAVSSQTPNLNKPELKQQIVSDTQKNIRVSHPVTINRPHQGPGSISNTLYFKDSQLQSSNPSINSPNNQSLVKKLPTPLKLNKKIPHNEISINPIKLSQEQLLDHYTRSFKTLLELVNYNKFIDRYAEMSKKFEDMDAKGSIEARSILDRLTNRLQCDECEQKKIEFLFELTCGHMLCKAHLEREAISSIEKNIFQCPVCKKEINQKEVSHIWEFIGVDKRQKQRNKLEMKFRVEKQLKCESCKQFKKKFFLCCLHICKECFAESVRLSIAPCQVCHELVDYDAIYKENFKCDNCEAYKYFVGSYGKFFKEEKYVFCVECSYDFLNQGWNQKFGIRLNKLEKLELNDHIFAVCAMCKMEVFKDNLVIGDCGHKVCNECKKENVCAACELSDS